MRTVKDLKQNTYEDLKRPHIISQMIEFTEKNRKIKNSRVLRMFTYNRRR